MIFPKLGEILHLLGYSNSRIIIKFANGKRRIYNNGNLELYADEKLLKYTVINIMPVQNNGLLIILN